MDLWLPGYARDPEPGAGLSVAAGRPKAILHSTESPRGSWAPVRALWRGPANWGRGLPTFLYDVLRGSTVQERMVQLLPLNVGAYTLENAPGGADTNRSGPAVQVELCTYSGHALLDEEYDDLGHWLADLKRSGFDINLTEYPRFYNAGEGIVLASYTSPIRMTAAQYEAFNGFGAHQHAPENAHWDVPLDPARVSRLALIHMGTPEPELPQEWSDMATEAEQQAMVERAVEKATRPEVWIATDGDVDGVQVTGKCWLVSPTGGTRSWIERGDELESITMPGPYTYKTVHVPGARVRAQEDITKPEQTTGVVIDEDELVAKIVEAVEPNTGIIAAGVIHEIAQRLNTAAA